LKYQTGEILNWSMRHIILILFFALISAGTIVKAEPASEPAEKKIEVNIPSTHSAPSTEKIEVTVPEKLSAPGPEHLNSPKITLVLGGGGCKAVAEIGVLKVFDRNKIPINYIVGTSAGAIIGALYAAGVPLEDIEKMTYDGSLQRAMTPHLFRHLLSLPLFKIAHLVGTKPSAGLMSGGKLEKFLRKKLPNDFSDLKIHFAAIATDLESGNTSMLTNGDLCKALAASSAVPLLIRPVAINNTLYIDGGIKANLPTHCALLTGADVIIAVSADAQIRNEKKRKFSSMMGVALRVTDIMEAQMDKHRWEDADLVLYPKVADTPAFTQDQEIIKRTINAGEEAATAALPRLQVLLASKALHKPSP
jgi:NTE family protein